MSYKQVSVFMVVVVLALTALDALIVYRLDDPVKVIAHAALRVFCVAAAAVAAAMAAARFRWWDEYVGRAWTLLSALYALIAVNESINRFAPSLSSAGDVAVIAGNLAAVGAFWLFGRALHNAGLQFYGPRAVKILVFLGAVAVACALVLPTILTLLAEQGPPLARTSSFVSAAADMVTFILVAPLLLTVWAFRGGQLSWVYGFLVLSTFGWMLNQAADDILPSQIIRDGQMLGFILACGAVAAAAYSQLVSSRRGATNA